MIPPKPRACSVLFQTSPGAGDLQPQPVHSPSQGVGGPLPKPRDLRQRNSRFSVNDLVSAVAGVNQVQARLLLLPYAGPRFTAECPPSNSESFLHGFIEGAYGPDRVYKFKGDRVFSSVCGVHDALALVDAMESPDFHARMYGIGCTYRKGGERMAHTLLRAWHDDWQLTLQLEAIQFEPRP